MPSTINTENSIYPNQNLFVFHATTTKQASGNLGTLATRLHIIERQPWSITLIQTTDCCAGRQNANPKTILIDLYARGMITVRSTAKRSRPSQSANSKTSSTAISNFYSDRSTTPIPAADHEVLQIPLRTSAISTLSWNKVQPSQLCDLVPRPSTAQFSPATRTLGKWNASNTCSQKQR